MKRLLLLPISLLCAVPVAAQVASPPEKPPVMTSAWDDPFASFWSGCARQVKATMCHYQLASDEERLTRNDLSAPRLPLLARVTQRLTRVLLDQRPHLRTFTVARADFAY
ncbi:hypothetical protein GO986_16130 [Deinococcus sp. HMF7620]|uniref:Uncharacterized protein n=1 Tax=Deinococcus arboris TaxID=2682977 RepID=A0A7C9HT37_9DEIO|nr:hypothetical protein [Deinococcus arboris]MVN88274.1 hypothetical protein [Deinococcus arboris]